MARLFRTLPAGRQGLAFLESYEESCDCITAFDLLEHLTKDETLALLRATHRALKPGGHLLLKVPNADGPFGAKILYSDFTHEQAFTPRSIAQVLAATGFAQIKVLPEGPRVHGIVSAARWAAWQALRALLVLYLAVETGRLRGHLLTQNLIAVAHKPFAFTLRSAAVMKRLAEDESGDPHASAGK